MNPNPTIPGRLWSYIVGFSVFLVASSSLACCAAAPFIALPQGLAEPTGHTGFFASADGGIEALDLANGNVLWQTHEAQRPLLLDGNRLLTQAGTKRNRLRILGFDLNHQGHCEYESDPVIFPAWVVTGEAHGRAFVSHWQVDRHHLVLDWEARAWYAGKTKPKPEEAQAARKQASGTARIDLRTGQIDILPLQKKPQPPPLALPDHWEKKALRWHGQMGPHCKALSLEEENGVQCFVLHSWDPRNQTEETPKKLLWGKRLIVRVTLDERILCLREMNPSPDERMSLMPKKATHPWSLFSVENGEYLGHLPDEPGMNAITVLGKRVFYLVPGTFRGSLNEPSIQPQILRVLDLTTGKKLWEHPVAGKLIDSPPL